MTEEKQAVEENTEEKTNGEILSDEIGSVLSEIVEENATPQKPVKPKRIHQINETQLTIDNREYQLVANYRDAFDLEKLEERYSDVLNRYDYIVADWGFDQLRLKGFYSDSYTKAPVDQRIGTLQDYLYEFCNFGCAYFVLEQIGHRKEKQPMKNKNKKKVKNKKTTTNTAHIDEKKIVSNKPKFKPKKRPLIKSTKEISKEERKETSQQNPEIVNNQVGKRNFTIRKKES